MTDLGARAIDLANLLEAASDENVADETIAVTAACIHVARRSARLARDAEHLKRLTMLAAENISVLTAIEFEKLILQTAAGAVDGR